VGELVGQHAVGESDDADDGALLAAREVGFEAAALDDGDCLADLFGRSVDAHD
jgi:hypothetical protein